MRPFRWRREMAWDPLAEVAHVDELIDRVVRARNEARAHGNVVLVDINERKLDELIELREILTIPKQREPE